MKKYRGWKKTAAFLLAFTLAAVPLSQTGAKDGLFGGRSNVAHADSDINGDWIDVSGNDSGTLSSDMTCTDFYVLDHATLTINKGITLTLNTNNFAFFDNSKIELHGELTGSANGDSHWMMNSYINVYLSDGAKYTVTGLSCMDGDNYLRYYGYDADTDGNGTVSVKNGDTAVTAESIGYKTTSYTYTATPASGYRFKNWTKGAGGEVIGTDESIEVTCEQNGQYQVYANFEESAAPAVAPELTNASITLGDDLVLNFFADNVTAENAADYKVKFTGDCVDSESGFTLKGGNYCASTHIYAKDASGDITAQIYKGDEAVGDSVTYSITDYLEAAKAQYSAQLAADPTNQALQNTVALITATDLFCNASQSYFEPTATVNDATVAAAIDNYMTKLNLNDDSIKAALISEKLDSDDVKISLVLDSKTAVRLYVKGVEPGTVSGSYTSSAGGFSNSTYPSYFEIPDLTPQHLADPLTITVDSETYDFSALTWCQRVMDNDNADDKDKNIAKAIYAYYMAANAYTNP